MAHDLPLLPTTVVGSHGKPGWWYLATQANDHAELGPFDLHEMLDDAADTAIRDMDRAGVDIITDGEVRRLDGYVDSYYAIIDGIEPTHPGRKLGPWGYDQQTRYRAVDRIRVPDAGLGIIDEFKYARTHSSKALKATCAGPLTFASRILPGAGYGNVVEIAEEFAHLINRELKGLVAAGADFIQLDDPARGTVSGQEMARIYNLATEGVEAKLAYHLCFGNRYGRGRFLRSYAPYFPGILDARADQFVLEFASRELSEIDLWPGWAGDRELGAGLIDVKSFYPESPEDVARRIRAVLKHVRPEKLYVNPDCGFGWSPRTMCNQKLQSMVEGTQIVRDEMAGTSTALDPG